MTVVPISRQEGSMDNFAEYPESVTELRRSDDASDWTPRDVLISLLRQMDQGELDPSAVVVAFRVEVEEGNATEFRASAPDLCTSLGMLEITKAQLLNLV